MSKPVEPQVAKINIAEPVVHLSRVVIPPYDHWLKDAYTFRNESQAGTKPPVLKMAERDLVQMIARYRHALGPDALAALDHALEKVRWRMAEAPEASRS